MLFFTAYSGQKCSAQSALFVHSNWVKAGILPKLEELAGRRKLSDLTIGPILTVNNDRWHTYIRTHSHIYTYIHTYIHTIHE